MREFMIIVRDEVFDALDIERALNKYDEVEFIDVRRVYRSRMGDVVKMNDSSIVFLRTSNEEWISSNGSVSLGVGSIESDVNQGYATLVMRDGKPV